MSWASPNREISGSKLGMLFNGVEEEMGMSIKIRENEKTKRKEKEKPYRKRVN